MLPKREQQLIEARVEDHLVKRVAEKGGETRKVKWQGRRGAPDRLVLMLDRHPTLVELKRPKGGRFEAGQEREHRKLRLYRFNVVVLDTIEKIDRWIDYCDTPF